MKLSTIDSLLNRPNQLSVRPKTGKIYADRLEEQVRIFSPITRLHPRPPNLNIPTEIKKKIQANIFIIPLCDVCARESIKQVDFFPWFQALALFN